MKIQNFTIILCTLLSFMGIAQNSIELGTDQNPNYKISLDKYVAASKDISQTLTQGTTSQETYVAIDPMEEKRKRKELRKYFRSQRPLWRHQERLERAKSPSFFRGRNRSFNTRYGNNFFNRSWFNNHSLLN